MLPLSIVTPAYNAAAFLPETIDSILAQGYPALDYVVVDDGSTDATPAALARYAGRLRVVRQANAGEQAAVNAGVALARHDIIAIINADDPIRPGLLAAVAAAFTRRPELVAVYPDWVMIDAAGRETRRVKTLDYDYLAMLDRHLCIPGPGVFFRRSALRGESPRDGALRYSGDFALWLRLGLAGPMERLPGFLATWRQHDAGASAAHSREMQENKLRVVERFFARADLPPSLRTHARQALSAACYRAATHAMHNPALPARRLLLRSYALAPVWPWRREKALRRRLLHGLFILALPWSARLWRRFVAAPLS